MEFQNGYYKYMFHDIADPRVNEWFLMNDPSQVMGILTFYLFFVLKLGPSIMQNRKAIQFKNTLVLYNLFQVFLSIWIFCRGVKAYLLYKYSWKCQPVDLSSSPAAIDIAIGVYVFFLAKITELLDTIFFVLRKKKNQVTFLHLYHHTFMPLFAWCAVKYFPGGQAVFVGLVNSFVHIIMYTYYIIAAMGPQYQKYLWWKKYITMIQLIQFLMIFLHNIQLLYYDCGFPRWSLIFTLPNTIFFYYLFSDFYNTSYKSKINKKN